MRIAASIAISLAFSSTPVAAAEAGRGTLDLVLRGTHIEGAPLVWSERQVEFLDRDGRLWSFAPQEAKQVRRISPSFRGYSAAELRSRLSGELGKSFEISGTGHYLVAHAPGQKDYWSRRFEDLYRSFVHYFSVRGFRLSEPEFPLVAIVFRNQRDFLRYAERDGAKMSSQVLGYYSPASNRVSLFDIGGGNASAGDWHANADTIIHEATHQTAFNTGVHTRFGVTPRWLAEGLGTMFEAKGVWNSTQHSSRGDRLNRGRLARFKNYVSRRPAGSLPEFVSSDRIFGTDPDAAYAEAWALSFFLVETRPRQYSQLLARTAGRPAFRAYPAAERLADFSAVFGKDLRLLEAHYLKFMEEIP
ncbi:MAG TPA: DUF1570 domain-containing protein [Pirellulales bacterium]|nr:DUF1570 domain-containing protein [Pirellulales bacterium]